jgi:creatinine amidohydrolase
VTLPANDRIVQLELLRPSEIRAALAANSTVYMPLGTIEWHSFHLPVGLDGLTAQGVCERAAVDHGGLVYPVLYFGTGGGHGDYPWTVMMPTETHIRALIEHALHRLQHLQVERVVLFTGHFADEQLAMIASIRDDWNARASSLSVVSCGINMAEGVGISPDHAGVFETTVLSALWPDRVELSELASLAEQPLAEDDWDSSRHDPSHALWGVIGPDPRRFDPAAGAHAVQAIADWLSGVAARPR